MIEIKNIEKQAKAAANRFNPEGRFPFPFENILEAEAGLRISETDELPPGTVSIFGHLDDFYIFVDKNRSEEKKFFAIAHSLGHYFLHKEEVEKSGGSIVDRDPGEAFLCEEAWVMEGEANVFAGGLIMPDHLVRQKYWRFKENKIGSCARFFHVPPFEMEMWLKYLKLM